MQHIFLRQSQYKDRSSFGLFITSQNCNFLAMQVFSGLSIHHFGPDLNISKTAEWMYRHLGILNDESLQLWQYPKFVTFVKCHKVPPPPGWSVITNRFPGLLSSIAINLSITWESISNKSLHYIRFSELPITNLSSFYSFTMCVTAPAENVQFKPSPGRPFTNTSE